MKWTDDGRGGGHDNHLLHQLDDRQGRAMTETPWTPDQQDNDATQPAALVAAQALSRLTDLARIVLQTQLSLARQTVDITWGSLVGDLDRVIANKSYAESVAREGARCWRTVGELGFHYATDLVSLGRNVSTSVLRELVAAGRRTAAAARGPYAAEPVAGQPAGEPVAGEPDGRERRVDVRLRGSVGQRAEGTIMVANQHPRPRRIQLSAGDLVDSTGAAVAAAVKISPTTLTVTSGQERLVRIEVDLDDAAFAAGQWYSCAIDVSGGDKATIDVIVQVEGLSSVGPGLGRTLPSDRRQGSPPEQNTRAGGQ
jgi:hypothetical protein